MMTLYFATSVVELRQCRKSSRFRRGQSSLTLLSDAYLPRFQTSVAVPPTDEATVYLSSSPLNVSARFCS